MTVEDIGRMAIALTIAIEARTTARRRKREALARFSEEQSVEYVAGIDDATDQAVRAFQDADLAVQKARAKLRYSTRRFIGKIKRDDRTGELPLEVPTA